MTYTTTLNLFGDERYSARHPDYFRVAVEAAQAAVAEWLRGIDGNHTYPSSRSRASSASLECFAGHWGTNARWRWAVSRRATRTRTRAARTSCSMSPWAVVWRRGNDVPVQTLRCRRTRR